MNLAVQFLLLFYILKHFSRDGKQDGIESWDWNLSGENSTYHALFPRSWTVYDGIIHNHSVLSKYLFTHLINT